LQEYKSLLDESVEKNHGLEAIIATLQEQVDGQVSSSGSSSSLSCLACHYQGNGLLTSLLLILLQDKSLEEYKRLLDVTKENNSELETSMKQRLQGQVKE